MTRALSSALATEIQQPLIRPFLLFEGAFASGTLRVWSGIGDLVWSSQTWQGVGTLGAVSEVEESDGIKARGITVTLSGIPASYLAIALADVRRAQVGKVFLGAFDAAGAVIVDPHLLFEGRLDATTITESGDIGSIAIAYEDELIDLDRARVSRFTDEEQQSRYAGDTFFNMVTSIQDRAETWGVGL